MGDFGCYIITMTTIIPLVCTESGKAVCSAYLVKETNTLALSSSVDTSTFEGGYCIVWLCVPRVGMSASGGVERC